MDFLWLGGQRPRDIPPLIYVHLLSTLEVPYESLIGLRSVQKTGFWEGKPVTFIRIYNPLASEEAAEIKNFTSLDQHQELILYEGYWGGCNKNDFTNLDQHQKLTLHESQWGKYSKYVFMECKTASENQPRQS